MRNWSDDEDAILKRMWTAGKTAGQIVPHLPGRSRSSIISRAHRLDCIQPEKVSLATKTAPAEAFGGAGFQRLIDRVIDGPANYPVSIHRAAQLENVHPDVAAALWQILCRNMGPQATPGDFLERRA